MCGIMGYASSSFNTELVVVGSGVYPIPVLQVLKCTHCGLLLRATITRKRRSKIHFWYRRQLP